MAEYEERHFGWRSHLLLLFVIAVALILLLPDVAGAQSSTKTFQYGTDVTLDEYHSRYNYGSSSKCYLDGAGKSGRERSTLLSWNISTLPKSSTITKATIHLRVNNPSKHIFYVNGLRKKWVESQATWEQARVRSPWATEGAKGSADRYSRRAGTLYAKQTGTAMIKLDPDLVQGWLNYPTRNYGVIIANTAATDGLIFFCSETTQKTQRPKLVIEYRR